MVQCSRPPSEISIRSRTSGISAPMVRIHRILLIHIQLKELVVVRALKILEPNYP